MTLKRLLGIALVVALLFRIWPVIGPFVWPALEPKVEQLKLRADIGTAVVMLGLALATFAQGERAWAAVVALFSIPSILAVARAVRR